MTSEMAFIESLLLQKRHFLSSKRGRLFKKYFFSFCNWGTLAQKKGTFFTFKKSGGGTCPHCPPPVPRPLHWGDHVDYISSKINKKFGLLKRIKSCLPLDARITFVKSYILPLIDYGDICWGDRGNETLMNDLQILHNKAAKIVLDQPIYSSATDALSNLNGNP